MWWGRLGFFFFRLKYLSRNLFLNPELLSNRKTSFRKSHIRIFLSFYRHNKAHRNFKVLSFSESCVIVNQYVIFLTIKFRYTDSLLSALFILINWSFLHCDMYVCIYNLVWLSTFHVFLPYDVLLIVSGVANVLSVKSQLLQYRLLVQNTGRRRSGMWWWVSYI